MAEEILGEAFTTSGVVGGDEFFAAVVDAEAGVFPGEEVGEFGGADEFGVAEGFAQIQSPVMPRVRLPRRSMLRP